MTKSYDEPEVNIPLLRKGLEWVEWQDTLPLIDSEWNQGDFVIDPEVKAFIMIAGERFRSENRMTSGEMDALVTRVAPHCGTAYCFAGYVGQLEDGRYATRDEVDGIHVGLFAQEQLGITDDQAEALFSADNTAHDIRSICEDIAGEPL
jgi:hypothetical protein